MEDFAKRLEDLEKNGRLERRAIEERLDLVERDYSVLKNDYSKLMTENSNLSQRVDILEYENGELRQNLQIQETRKYKVLRLLYKFLVDNPRATLHNGALILARLQELYDYSSTVRHPMIHYNNYKSREDTVESLFKKNPYQGNDAELNERVTNISMISEYPQIYEADAQTVLKIFDDAKSAAGDLNPNDFTLYSEYAKECIVRLLRT
ncbi:hypothetical protein AKO1_012666 [Acrasis kona]|uniref:Uncharacterized protein n=1 Tax=Acrasis kona TaxID=1008807 RepID=A0AAW2YWT2_9EUKA